jgi:predicted metal-dependent HD superfamily phosphohydrolase
MLPFKEEQASKYIIELFKSKLPEELTFHNLGHTKDVVKAVRLIGDRSGISKEEDQLLRVAAWFHDSGYVTGYANHEAESIAIAETFLELQLCSNEQIDQIKDLIAATRVPQHPKNLLSCIICDADLFHLSKRNYKKYENRLRKEWELCLGEIYYDKEWKQLNLDFLNTHHYFTAYGKTVLQQQKLINIGNVDL